MLPIARLSDANGSCTGSTNSIAVLVVRSRGWRRRCRRCLDNGRLNRHNRNHRRSLDYCRRRHDDCRGLNYGRSDQLDGFLNRSRRGSRCRCFIREVAHPKLYLGVFRNLNGRQRILTDNLPVLLGQNRLTVIYVLSIYLESEVFELISGFIEGEPTNVGQRDRLLSNRCGARPRLRRGCLAAAR